MNTKVYMVTGVTSGLGKAIALEPAKTGETVIMVERDAERAAKMANLLSTFELARRMQNTGVTVNAIHPGLVPSSIMKEAFAPIRFLTWLFSSSPKRVAEEIVKVATAPEFENTTGKFLHRGREVEAPAYALNPAIQLKLWEMSEKLVDVPQTSPTK